MGAGGSLEAVFTLVGAVPAGSWHLTGDGIVLAPNDLRYDVIWRHGVDTPIASLTHHFDPLTGPDKFFATQLDADLAGSEAAAARGDQLVLRFSATVMNDASAGVTDVFIPNGDGASAHGRIPSLTLPR